MPGDDGSALVVLRTGGGIPVYCVHPASGSVAAYLPFARALPVSYAVYGLAAPDPGPAPEPGPTVAGLAGRYADEIAEHGPGAVLGWSMGGVVAFEVARAVALRGVDVPLLAIVDALPPEPVPPAPESAILARFLTDLTGAEPGLPGPAFDDLDAVRVFERLLEIGALPPEFDSEDVDLLADLYLRFRGNCRAVWRHTASGRYDGPAVFVRAAESPSVSGGWRRWVPGLREHVVPGDHDSIWAPDRVGRLATLLSGELEVNTLG